MNTYMVLTNELYGGIINHMKTFESEIDAKLYFGTLNKNLQPIIKELTIEPTIYETKVKLNKI